MDKYVNLILTIYFILSIIFGIFKREYLIYLYFSSLIFFGLILDIGLQINAEKIVGTAALLFVPIGLNSNIRFKGILLFYLIFCSIITIIMSINLPDYTQYLPPARGTYRGFLQIVVLFILYSPVFFVSNLLNTRKKIEIALNIYVVFSLMMCLVGILQFVVFVKTGTNLFPLSNFDSKSAPTIEATIFKMMRVNALTGEPKHLALALIGSLSIILFNIYLKLNNLFYSILKVFLIIAVIFLTFSTQGLVLIGLVFFVVPFLCISFQRRISKRVAGTIIVFSIGLITLIFNPLISSIINSRVLERIEKGDEESYKYKGFEDYDQAVLGYLEVNPDALILGKGLGNIHLYAYPYIPEECRYYMDKQVFYSKKGFLRQLTEVGIFGFILFLLLFIIPIRNILKLTNRTDYLGIMICSLCILNLIIYLNTCDGPNFCPMSLILLFSYEKILRNEKRIKYNTIDYASN